MPRVRSYVLATEGMGVRNEGRSWLSKPAAWTDRNPDGYHGSTVAHGQLAGPLSNRYSVKFRQILKHPCVVVISWLLRSPPNLRIPLANLVCKSNFPKWNSKSIGALAAQTTKQNERLIDLCLDIPNSFCEPILGVEIPDPQSSHAGTADQAQRAEKRVLRVRLAVSHSATVFSQPYCQAYAISMQLMQQNSNPNSKLAYIAFVAGKRLTYNGKINACPIMSVSDCCRCSQTFLCNNSWTWSTQARIFHYLLQACQV